MSAPRKRCALHLGTYHLPCVGCGATVESIGAEQEEARRRIAYHRGWIDYLEGRSKRAPSAMLELLRRAGHQAGERAEPMSEWRNRVRVSEIVRRPLFSKTPPRVEGYRVELRMSGDDEPERWERPNQAAVVGPVVLVDALDGASEQPLSRERADKFAAWLVKILVAVEDHPGRELDPNTLKPKSR